MLVWVKRPHSFKYEPGFLRCTQSWYCVSCMEGTCQKLAGREEGGGGVETEGGSKLFETAEKGGVMKNAPLKGGGHANMCP